ncbi:hypothetical protein [Paenibacillus sp. Marseille-Q4541]|uniref:hypothetical protein n=1 Tax=Paenibacillus sp. Marseille-Q4541 TaxID=2831522 RepID=UPI001BA8E9F9|nr:hypothetical protein [Paenibacillus sp. Marseille-Q4541]
MCKLGENTRDILFFSAVVSLWIAACIFAISLLSSMDNASDERRLFHAAEDGRIQMTYESPDTDVVSGSYVHAYVYASVYASQNKEDRNNDESHSIKIDGLDVEDATIDPNFSYVIKYERGPAGSLQQISFWKESNSP